MTKLRQIRIASKQKLREVAEKVGVTPQTVHDAEMRGVRNIAAAKRYARALNCDPLEIIEL